MLVYPDVRAAVTWLEAAFGFEESVCVGEVHRARLRVGPDGALIVADLRGRQVPSSAGWATHVLGDLAGHRWELTQTVRDVEPEQRGGVTVSPW
ncbi:MAG TPA: hypothetical protein VHM65_05980 [Candidatus Lustribacter sp.]|nr:hypothetical protein [Candidatus Lustribacter sp.]